MLNGQLYCPVHKYCPHSTCKSAIYNFPFTDDQATASSKSRELLAIHHALVNDSHNFSTFSSQLVYWQTDNQASVRFLQTGSCQPHIQSLILDIKQKEQDLNIAVIPVWTPRNYSRIAAPGSCFAASTDELFIDRASLAAVFQHCSFFPGLNCVDCFASAANDVSDAFYSLIPQQNSLGVNFFTISPHQPVLFLCPLISQIARAYCRILALPGKRSLLIVPHWPSSVFWPVLFSGVYRHSASSASHEFRPACYSPMPCLFTATCFVFNALLIYT
jgi:hypothetical protein